MKPTGAFPEEDGEASPEDPKWGHLPGASTIDRKVYRIVLPFVFSTARVWFETATEVPGEVRNASSKGDAAPTPSCGDDVHSAPYSDPSV